jgi:hypothetical protein
MNDIIRLPNITAGVIETPLSYDQVSKFNPPHYKIPFEYTEANTGYPNNNQLNNNTFS